MYAATHTRFINLSAVFLLVLQLPSSDVCFILETYYSANIPATALLDCEQLASVPLILHAVFWCLME